MISALQGGLLNNSNLANSSGVSSTTVNKTISFFERSFIVRLLQPLHSSIGKRLVKTPKIYIRDAGYEKNVSDNPEVQTTILQSSFNCLSESSLIDLDNQLYYQVYTLF